MERVLDRKHSILFPLNNNLFVVLKSQISSCFCFVAQIFWEGFGGVLVSVNFDCFSPSRFSHFHCCAMRKVIKARKNSHKRAHPGDLWMTFCLCVSTTWVISGRDLNFTSIKFVWTCLHSEPVWIMKHCSRVLTLTSDLISKQPSVTFTG